MTYALDTDASIEVLRGRNPKVSARYIKTDPASIGLPSIVAGELMVGALKSVRPNAMVELEGFLSRHEIVTFGETEFRIYAEIRAALESRGMKIGPNDLIVAATTLSVGATLITRNIREFSRVPGLRIIDWEQV